MKRTSREKVWHSRIWENWEELRSATPAIEDIKAWIKNEGLPRVKESILANGCLCPDSAAAILAVVIGVGEIEILVDDEKDLIDEEVAKYIYLSNYEKRCHITEKGYF